MIIFLSILQILIALLFIQHGFMLLKPPASFPEKMAKGMSYVHDLHPNFRRFIGVAEVLGGLGVILPAATGILPWLTPLAAAGLALTMIGAMVFHLGRKEHPNIAFNFVLFALAAFVAYMRWIVYPF